MSAPAPKICRGLPFGSEGQAAALYWQAFGDKLGILLGPRTRAEAFFAATLSHGSVISALDASGDLLGIAAVQSDGVGFSAGGVRDLWRHYGVGMVWRVVPLALLERSAPEDVMQMDGICVAAGARGRGVGTALLQAVAELGRERGCRAVRLDVIDRNIAARRLYERMGFVAVRQESTGPLRPLLGFATATRMELAL